MKISVIVPVYNAEKYLSQCLDSIIHQTYCNLEILLIDDGSTDGSLEICRNYKKKDHRIKVIHKENEGPSKTRNIGIAHSTGDYIIFIDSDDYIEKNMLEEMYKAISEKEVDVVRCNIKKYMNSKEYVNENMYELSNRKFAGAQIEKILYHFLTHKQNLGCYSVLLLMKKEVVLSFNTNYHFMEDYEYYARLLLNIDSIYFLDQSFYHYRYNGQGLSKNKERALKNIYDMVGVIGSVEKILEENMTIQQNKLIKQINSTCFIIFIAKFMTYMDNDVKKAHDQMKKIVKTDNLQIKKYLYHIDFGILNIIKKVEYILFRSHMYFILCIVLKKVLVRR